MGVRGEKRKVSVPFEYDLAKYPPKVKDHLHQRKLERKFSLMMAYQVDRWAKTNPMVPSQIESPYGWFKRFPRFVIVGRGPYWFTLYTDIGSLHVNSKLINWDEWVKTQAKNASLRETISHWINSYLPFNR